MSDLTDRPEPVPSSPDSVDPARRAVLGAAMLAALSGVLAVPALGQPTSSSRPATIAGLVHGRTRVGGAEVHHISAGNAPGVPLVLLHGWPETWWQWHKAIPILAQRRRVIAVDLPGLGDSSKSLVRSDGAAVAELLRGTLRALGHNRVDLVGHDVSSPSAYLWAATYPQEVRRLAILDFPMPGLGLWKFVQEQLRPWHFGFHQAPGLAETVLEGRERPYLAWFFRTFSANPDMASEADLDEFVRCSAGRVNLKSGFEHYRAFPETERQVTAARRTPLPMPLLALGGDKGFGARTAEQFRGFASDLRGDVIPNAGHYLPLEAPRPTAERLLAFFS